MVQKKERDQAKVRGLWQGKTDPRRLPMCGSASSSVTGGVCHIAKRNIMAGELWDLDHVIALINSGKNRETNLAPALRDKHREKTKADVAEKSSV
jgi:5-methylcytosine-specific restriction protein A